MYSYVFLWKSLTHRLTLNTPMTILVISLIFILKVSESKYYALCAMMLGHKLSSLKWQSSCVYRNWSVLWENNDNYHILGQGQRKWVENLLFIKKLNGVYLFGNWRLKWITFVKNTCQILTILNFRNMKYIREIIHQ